MFQGLDPCYLGPVRRDYAHAMSAHILLGLADADLICFGVANGPGAILYDVGHKALCGGIDGGALDAVVVGQTNSKYMGYFLFMQ